MNGKADAPLQLDYAMVVAARAAIGERLALAAAATTLPAPATAAAPLPVRTASAEAPQPLTAPPSPTAPQTPVRLAKAALRETQAAVQDALLGSGAQSASAALKATPIAPIPFTQLASRDARAAAMLKVAVAESSPTRPGLARLRPRTRATAPAAPAAAPLRVAVVAAGTRPALSAHPVVRRLVKAQPAALAQPWVERIRSLVRAWLPSVRV